VDEDSFKGTRQKLNRNEHEGQVEEHESSHVENVCVEEDQTITYDITLELIDEADDTSVLDGYNYDEDSKSVDVEDPTYVLMYDAYDEGDSSIITPTHDEDSVPYPIYDVYDDEGMTVEIM